MPRPGAKESSPSPGLGGAVSRWRSGRVDRLEVLVPLVVYLLVVLTGASTSSLGVPMLREDPTRPLGTTWGEPLPIRSDEWFTQAPIELAVLIQGQSTRSPLAQEPDLIYQISSGGLFESVLFFEGNLLRLGPWLPDAMLFAAFRAFPWLLVVLCLPPLLRRLGASRPMSWLAVTLCAFAPASLWWSFMPIRVLAFAAAGGYLLVLARDQLVRTRPGPAVVLSGLAGILLARLVTYYVPWGLTVGVPLVAATTVWLVFSGRRRQGLTVLGVGAVVGAIVLAGTLWNNLPALQAELNTVYPGLRRSSGGPNRPLLLLGAPGLMQMEQEPAPLMLNQSELSSGFLVCGLWAAMLWRWLRPTGPSRSAEVRTADVRTLDDPARPDGDAFDVARGRRYALVTLAVSLMVWTAWSTISFGPLGERIPLLNVVTPPRAAQTVGFTAALLLSLVLSQVSSAVTRRAAVAAGLACGAATAYGVSDLRSALPTVSAADVWVVSVVTALAVGVVTLYRHSWVPVAVTALVLGGMGATVNPIIFGLGDLRASGAAGHVRELGATARSAGLHVVSDDWSVDALLVANGAPALTGYQVTGPVRDEWAKVDPDGRYETNWNQGASYLKMEFGGEPGADAVVTNPKADVILITVDPCRLVELEVGYLISNEPRPQRCLIPEGEFLWNGIPQYTYRLTG